MLLVPFAESCEEHLGFVCPTIAIGVASKQDVRSGADEDAVAPRHHAARIGQGIEENS